MNMIFGRKVKLTTTDEQFARPAKSAILATLSGVLPEPLSPSEGRASLYTSDSKIYQVAS